MQKEHGHIYRAPFAHLVLQGIVRDTFVFRVILSEAFAMLISSHARPQRALRDIRLQDCPNTNRRLMKYRPVLGGIDFRFANRGLVW